MEILNSKKVKQLKKVVADQWGAEVPDYMFLKNEKGRIFFANKDIFDLDTEKLKLQSIGIYFGEMKNGDLRLSIEGSQIIGKTAKKNVYEVDDPSVWISGNDIDVELEAKGFVIISHKGDFLGTGKYSKDQKKIFNYVPKERRVRTDN